MKFGKGKQLMQLADKCRNEIIKMKKRSTIDQILNSHKGQLLYARYTGMKNELVLQELWFIYCAERKLHPLHTVDDLLKSGGNDGKAYTQTLGHK